MHRLVLTALVLASSGVAAGCSGGGGAETTATVTVVETRPAPRAAAGGGDAFDRIPELVDRVEPSVVSVVTDGGEGSGVVWDAKGTIVTNWHVIDGAQTVRVVLESGAELPAEVRASTQDFDLAVLRVRRNLPPVTFASELPEVGELALAMGNPLGFENSVTAGIVSALHREIPSGGTTPALVDLLQTDAAISPGNSGGALVNGDGEVIGINVAYLPPSQTGAVAIGFAIPSTTVKRVVTQLLRTGKVEQAYLGIVPVAVTPDLADRLGLGVENGVGIERIVSGGPAGRAGLRQGDVIVSLGGRTLKSVEDLFEVLRDKRPGDRVPVEVVRGGDRRSVEVGLAEKPQVAP